LGISIKSFVAAHLLNKLPAGLSQSIRKMHYVRLLRHHAEAQIPEFAVIRVLVRPGDCVVDVGANLGVFTKYLSALVGEPGRVCSIEPVPLTFDILCHCVNKLGLDNVEPVCCAMSDRTGAATMEVPVSSGGGEDFYRAHVADAAADRPLRRVAVELRTLDAVLAERLAQVTFIKCDVEGHELHCLKGAAGVIEKRHPAWFIEVSGDPDQVGSQAQATVELLRRAGYGAYWLDGAALVERRPGDQSIDYFFLSPDHVGALRQAGLLKTANP